MAYDDLAPGIWGFDESVLHDVAEGFAALGVPAPSPDLERQMLDALDAYRAASADPVRDLPAWRMAVVALLRGVASALAEDGLVESRRFLTRSGQRWWDRGFYGTRRLARGRFDRWDCTGCGHRVGDVNNTEHAPECRQHADNYADPWTQLWAGRDALDDTRRPG